LIVTVFNTLIALLAAYIIFTYIAPVTL